jgi:ABC-type phosphate transport system permease subunit
MTNNLAGVPSHLVFGMALFVNKLGFGDSILAGGLTLGLLVPVIIRTTEEALKAVDDTFRQASLALGASKWETTSKSYFRSHFQHYYGFDFVYRESFWRNGANFIYGSRVFFT